MSDPSFSDASLMNKCRSWWRNYWSCLSPSEFEEEMRQRRNMLPVESADGTVVAKISEFDNEWNKQALALSER